MEPRRRSSLQVHGVAAVLSFVRDEVAKEMQLILVARMESRKLSGLPTLSEEEIQSQAQLIGSQAKRLSANAIAAAYQRGIKGSSLTEESWPAETMRTTMIDAIRKKLTERRGLGRNELDDDEIEIEARIAGLLAKEAAEEAISESHRMGVDRMTTPEDHDRPTTPSGSIKKP